MFVVGLCGGAKVQLYYRRVDALNLITREHLMNLVLVIRIKRKRKGG